MNSPVNLYDHQTTADGWSLIYAIGFACFGAGALATAAVVWALTRFM